MGKIEMEHHEHEFPPIYNKDSRILILGSFPSVKSREQQFYYGHPQNRFWKVIAQVIHCDVPQSIEEKKQMLLTNQIALWDVIESCDIIGSSDSSIKNVVVNDLKQILDAAQINGIYANGATARKLYERYAEETTKMNIVGLPSTSPANAAYSIPRLVESWRVITKEIASNGITD